MLFKYRCKMTVFELGIAVLDLFNNIIRLCLCVDCLNILVVEHDMAVNVIILELTKVSFHTAILVKVAVNGKYSYLSFLLVVDNRGGKIRNIGIMLRVILFALNNTL